MRGATHISLLLAALWLASAGTVAVAAEPDRTPLRATTSGGDAVLLHPNGRWEYVDSAKNAAAKQVAEQYPENRTRPMDAQGGWFGTRMVMPGDADYNRGSLIRR